MKKLSDVLAIGPGPGTIIATYAGNAISALSPTSKQMRAENIKILFAQYDKKSIQEQEKFLIHTLSHQFTASLINSNDAKILEENIQKSVNSPHASSIHKLCGQLCICQLLNKNHLLHIPEMITKENIIGFIEKKIIKTVIQFLDEKTLHKMIEVVVTQWCDANANELTQEIGSLLNTLISPKHLSLTSLTEKKECVALSIFFLPDNENVEIKSLAPLLKYATLTQKQKMADVAMAQLQSELIALETKKLAVKMLVSLFPYITLDHQKQALRSIISLSEHIIPPTTVGQNEDELFITENIFYQQYSFLQSIALKALVRLFLTKGITPDQKKSIIDGIHLLHELGTSGVTQALFSLLQKNVSLSEREEIVDHILGIDESFQEELLVNDSIVTLFQQATVTQRDRIIDKTILMSTSLSFDRKTRKALLSLSQLQETTHDQKERINHAILPFENNQANVYDNILNVISCFTDSNFSSDITRGLVDNIIAPRFKKFTSEQQENIIARLRSLLRYTPVNGQLAICHEALYAFVSCGQYTRCANKEGIITTILSLIQGENFSNQDKAKAVSLVSDFLGRYATQSQKKGLIGMILPMLQIPDADVTYKREALKQLLTLFPYATLEQQEKIIRDTLSFVKETNSHIEKDFFSRAFISFLPYVSFTQKDHIMTAMIALLLESDVHIQIILLGSMVPLYQHATPKQKEDIQAVIETLKHLDDPDNAGYVIRAMQCEINIVQILEHVDRLHLASRNLTIANQLDNPTLKAFIPSFNLSLITEKNVKLINAMLTAKNYVPQYFLKKIFKSAGIKLSEKQLENVLATQIDDISIQEKFWLAGFKLMYTTLCELDPNPHHSLNLLEKIKNKTPREQYDHIKQSLQQIKKTDQKSRAHEAVKLLHEYENREKTINDVIFEIAAFFDVAVNTIFLKAQKILTNFNPDTYCSIRKHTLFSKFTTENSRDNQEPVAPKQRWKI